MIVTHPVDSAVLPADVRDVTGGVPLAAEAGERVGVERGRRARRRRLAAPVARVVLS